MSLRPGRHRSEGTLGMEEHSLHQEQAVELLWEEQGEIMFQALRSGKLHIILSCLAVLQGTHLAGQPVLVRQTEGSVHGFVHLTSEGGAVLADGDLEQTARGGRVTSRLIFRFRDGSVQDESTTFLQSGHFRLLTDHLVQKGPMFKRQMDLQVNGSTGMATSRYSDEDGKEKVESVHLDLPPDVSNGMIPILLKNLAPASSATVSMVVPAPKPQLVKLAISPEGEDSFLAGSTRYKATRYVVKIEIGGVKGAVASVLKKVPPDTRVWILPGTAPAFVRSEGPSCEGCAIWRIDLASPAWPKANTETAQGKK
jgi:hypothetical protein